MTLRCPHLPLVAFCRTFKPAMMQDLPSNSVFFQRLPSRCTSPNIPQASCTSRQLLYRTAYLCSKSENQDDPCLPSNSTFLMMNKGK